MPEALDGEIQKTLIKMHAIIEALEERLREKKEEKILTEEEILDWFARKGSKTSLEFRLKMRSFGFIPKDPGYIAIYIREHMPLEDRKKLYAQGVGVAEHACLRFEE